VPSFRWWFTSQVLSSSGLFTQNVAAAWLILQQTGNGLNLAFLTCAFFLPVFLAGSWGGQLADRFDHRRLLIATKASLLALSATLAVLAFAGRADLMSILFISAIARGCSGPGKSCWRPGSGGCRPRAR
jgi:MFS family permease